MRLAWQPPWYLIASILISVGALALANLSPESVRETGSLLALILVILIPGYLAILFQFPATSDLDFNRRILFSIGFSALLASLVGLVLMLTPRGLQPASLATILSLLSIFLGAISYLRWSALPRKRRFAFGPGSKKGFRSKKSVSRIPWAEIMGRRTLLIGALAAGCLVVAALAFFGTSMNHISSSGDGFTELEVSWPNGNGASDSQTMSLEAGRELEARARVVNHENGPVNYTLRLMFNNSTIFVKSLYLGQNETWQNRLGFILSGPAGLQRLDLLLFKERDYSSPYKAEHVWINLSEDASESEDQSEDLPQDISQNQNISQSQNSSGESRNNSASSPISLEETSKVTVLSAGGGVSSSASITANPPAGSAQPVAVAKKSAPSQVAEQTAKKSETVTVPAAVPASASAIDAEPKSNVSSLENSSAAKNATTENKSESTPLPTLPDANREKNLTPSTGASASKASQLPQSIKSQQIPSSAYIAQRIQDEVNPSNSSVRSAPSDSPAQSDSSYPSAESNSRTSQKDGDLASNLPPKLSSLNANQTNSSQNSIVQWTAKHATEDSFDGYLKANVTLRPSNQPPVLKGLMPDKTSPQAKGAMILWKAEALDPDNDKVLYKFLLNGHEARKWSKSNSWNWPTEYLQAGDYTITVLARDGLHASEDSFDSSLNATMALRAQNQIPILKELRSEMNSPSIQGTAIAWTASATDPDGDEVSYKFLVNGREAADWSSSSSWTWNTSDTAPGDYKITVLARDGMHAPPDSFDSEIEKAFTLILPIIPATTSPNQIPVLQEIKPNVISPQATGTAVTWTAVATDPDGDEVYYKFLANGREMSDWSTSGSWIWNTSAALPGDHKITVLAKDGFHASEGSSESSMDAAFTLLGPNQPPVLKGLKPDKSSPQVQGAIVAWKAEALDPDGDSILYKFQVDGKDMSRWSESNSWSWSTRGLAAGDYRISVLARDGRHAPESSSDSYLDGTFTLTTEIDQQIDQLMNQRGFGASGKDDYHSSDIQLAVANDTKARAVLGKASSGDGDMQKETATPRNLG